MKKSITIATFITSNEQCNSDFLETVKFLKQEFDVDFLIFSDTYTNHNGIKNERFTAGKTKFKRIDAALNYSSAEIILCIDNDVVINRNELLAFLNELYDQEFSLGWGKIDAQVANSFVAHLVSVDKFLSHSIIRPFLWKMKAGISVSGQVFFLKKSYFKSKLADYDTVFDDLTLGLICKKYEMPVYYSKKVLGYEKPKDSFRDLIKQRIRWAKGFSETLRYSKKMKLQRYVVLHGFMYHLLWILFYAIEILFVFNKNYIPPILLMCLISFILSNQKNKMWGFLYVVIFPMIHFIWLIALIKNIIKHN